MFGIGQFFKNIQNSFAKEVLIRSAIRDALKAHIGVDVPIEKISCKGSTAVIDGITQSARSALYIKKSALLKDVNSAQTLRVISEIR